MGQTIRINDYELMTDISILFSHSLILYGAGVNGRRICGILEQMGGANTRIL